MDVLVRPAPAASPRGPEAERAAQRVGRARGALRPGWPLSVLFVGYPVWWALGISEFVCMAMGLVMLADLVRRRRIAAPRGFGWWLLFLSWIPVGIVLLHVDAPGAVADNSSTRYLTFIYRVIWYVTATLALLYVGNNRAELPTRRLMRIMAAMFLTVTAGGLLGVLAPHFEFTSLAEYLLPNSLSNNSFVFHLIHPTAAQLQDVLGYQAPRPAAPFAYTNTWGLNYACFLPFFVMAWFAKDAGWRRYVAPFVLLIGAVPVIYSLDRGMWAALIVIALFVAARSALLGRPVLLAGVVAGAGAVVGLVLLTSLGGVVQDRFTHQNSNQGRTNLGTLTVDSVTHSSPIVGLGSTRNVQGNFNTITGGATADCPRCSPPALGTQGQLWLVVFCQGVVGLLLYLAFFTLMLLRHIHLRTPEAAAASCVLVVGFVTLPVYNSLGVALMAIMIACGVLWREGRADTVARHAGPLTGHLPAEPTIEGYLAPLRRYAVLVLACTLAGGLVAGLWQRHRGVDQAAVSTVLLPAAANYPTVADGPMNMDTEAQLITTPAVLAAVAKATGLHQPVDASSLTVTATPNTRILHIRYVDRGASAAVKGVSAATTEYLHARRTQLMARKKTEQDTLSKRAAQLDSALRSVDATLLKVDPPNSPHVTLAMTATLRQKRAAFITQIRTLNGQMARVSADPADPGTVIVPAAAFPLNDVYRVALANGVNLGFAAAALLAAWLYRRGRRLRRTRDVMRAVGVPVVAKVRTAGQLPSDDLHRAMVAVEVYRPAACLSVHSFDTASAEVAQQLDAYARPVLPDQGVESANPSGTAVRAPDAWETSTDRGPRRGGRPAVVLVASDKVRTSEISRVRDELGDLDTDVCGLVLTRQ